MRYECNTCDRTWRNEKELERDCVTLWPAIDVTRLEPGDVVPAAECPACGSVVLPVFEALARQAVPPQPDQSILPLPGNILGRVTVERQPQFAEVRVDFDLNGQRYGFVVPEHAMHEAQQRAADMLGDIIARALLMGGRLPPGPPPFYRPPHNWRW